MRNPKEGAAAWPSDVAPSAALGQAEPEVICATNTLCFVRHFLIRCLPCKALFSLETQCKPGQPDGGGRSRKKGPDKNGQMEDRLAPIGSGSQVALAQSEKPASKPQ